MVSDFGGFDDKSFNETSYKGLLQAKEQLRVETAQIESKEESEYARNVQSMIDAKCGVIVTVGYALANATEAAAKQNPNVKFAIVDNESFDGVDNAKGLMFDTAQPAFMAGYVAASLSQTGKVGTFGGADYPTVRIFMDGFAHGAWAVLKHLYPKAEIPVVQLSLNLMQPAQWHFDLAKKLAPLREQGVLVVSSGNIVHNLRAMRREPTAGYDWAIDFRHAINRALAARDNDTLVHYERLGDAAALSVPTSEHYLPLLYTAALRGPQDDMEIFNDELAFGSISMTSVLIG